MFKPVLISGLFLFAFFGFYGCTANADELKTNVATALMTREDSGNIPGNHSLVITGFDAMIEQVNVPDSLINDSIDTTSVEQPPLKLPAGAAAGAGINAGGGQPKDHGHVTDSESKPGPALDEQDAWSGSKGDSTGCPALQPKDSLEGCTGHSGCDPRKVTANERFADQDSQSRKVFLPFLKNMRKIDTGFFTSGFNFLTILILVILIFIAWQLNTLARRLSRLYDMTGRLYSRTKSQRVIKDISLICNRLEKIESGIDSLMAKGMAPVSDGSENPRPETGETGDTGYEAGTPGTQTVVAVNDESQTTPDGQETGPGMVFYMPSPDNEGNFDNRKKSDSFIPSESIYEFILDGNSDGNAFFSVYQDRNNMERAINYYSSILEKVCRGQNAFNPHGKTVKTIKPGHAVLNNNKWVVKEKALVRYE
jgi:hypothetical protein